MKRYYPYTIVWLFALVFLATSCEKEEPDFYDKNENGVYFDYNTSEEFQQSINFADNVVCRWLRMKDVLLKKNVSMHWNANIERNSMQKDNISIF